MPRCVSTHFAKAKCVETPRGIRGDLADRVSRGYRSFDSAQADRCLAAIQDIARTCTTSVPPECGGSRLSTPAGGLGDGCRTSDDCSDPSTACGGSSCPTTCQRAGGLNAPCTPAYTCDGEFWCDADHVCRAP